MKANEKIDKYLDLPRELKRLWNIKETVISIVVVAFGTVNRDLEKRLAELEIRGRMETIHTTTLLRSARILKRVQET